VSRAVAQFGSASGWGSEGRRFNSCQPDSNPPIISRQIVRGFVVLTLAADAGVAHGENGVAANISLVTVAGDG
jgi:hypothetical protein